MPSDRQRDAFTDSLALGASRAGPELRVAIAVRQFQRLMAVPSCAVTYLEPGSRAHRVVHAAGYCPALVGSIERFVASPLYRPGSSRPSWRTSPEFVASPVVTDVLRPAGFRDGTSVPLCAEDGREVGSLHLNLFTEGLSGTQHESLTALTDFLGPELDTRRRRESFGLTPRELEVLRLIAGGASNAEIAAELFIARRTVATHVENLLPKLNVTTRVAAAVTAVQNRLL